MAKDKYFYEDLMSNSMRLDQKDKGQKKQIQYLNFKVNEEQTKILVFEETIENLNKQITENELNIQQ